MTPSLEIPDVKTRPDGNMEEFLDNVDEELKFLSDRATRFEKSANFWYRIACIVMVLAGLFAIYRAGVSYAIIKSSGTAAGNLTWEEVVLSVASSLIVLALLGGIARFAYMMGKSFMVESIRNNNRRHAITFGRGYLSAFRHDITWPEAKDAFRFWNIDIGSSFLTQDPEDIDPQLFQNIAAIAKTVVEKARGKE
jgi:hypothetical protein